MTRARSSVSRPISDDGVYLDALRVLSGLPGYGEVPARLSDTAGALGARIELASLPHDGQVTRYPDGRSTILVNRRATRTRARFTIAHEIGHLVIDRALGVRSADDAERPLHEEALANRIGAELLMPKAFMNQSLEGTYSSPARIRSMAIAAQVSIAAMMWRVRDIDSVICAGLWRGDSEDDLVPMTTRGGLTFEAPFEINARAAIAMKSRSFRIAASFRHTRIDPLVVCVLKAAFFARTRSWIAFGWVPAPRSVA